MRCSRHDSGSRPVNRAASAAQERVAWKKHCWRCSAERLSWAGVSFNHAAAPGSSWASTSAKTSNAYFANACRKKERKKDQRKKIRKGNAKRRTNQPMPCCPGVWRPVEMSQTAKMKGPRGPESRARHVVADSVLALHLCKKKELQVILFVAALNRIRIADWLFWHL